MIQPVNDRILVRLDPPEGRIGSIEIPEAIRGAARSGVVVAVGPGKRMITGLRVPVDVPVGARVLFGQHAIDKQLPDGTAFITEQDVAVVC